MTQFERIKQMSVEELADVINCRLPCFYGGFKPYSNECYASDCKTCIIKWLNSEVKK